MSHSDAELSALAAELLAAKSQRRYARRPSHSGYALSVDEAYVVQAHQVRALEQSGATLRALKLGLTDEAQQQRAGWFAPSFGTLTDQMIIPAGGTLLVSAGLRPRVEPEIVVTLGTTLSDVPTSRDQLLDAIADVRVGIEVVDPRYDDSEFILTDALCDNASAHAGVIGLSAAEASSAAWADEELTLSINGVEQVRGVGAALMGDPLTVVHAVIAERLRLGLAVPEGLSIFTGNVAGKAVPVAAGDLVEVSGSTLGAVALHVVA